MPAALTQKKIDALANRRPELKREIADGGQPGLYLVVGPRTLGWLIRYRAPGTRQNVKLALGDYGQGRPAIGLHDARKLAQAKLKAVSEGRDPREGGEATKRRHLTVDEAFADFIERYAKTRNRQSTVREAEAFIRREIRPRWSGRRIQSVTRQDIVELVDGIADPKRGADGEIVSPGRPHSAVRVRALLSKSFSWFAAKSIVAENPFRDIEVPTSAVARDRVLSDDEIRWLWAASIKVGWPFGDLVRLLLLTGQRRDEVAAARRDEFQLDGADPSWSIPPERTKNGRRQNLPLVPQVVEILRAVPQVFDDVGKESPLLLSTNGRTPISGYSRAKTKIDEAMLSIARDLTGGIVTTTEPWTLHDLRRTAASGMAGLGVAVHVVEAVLNHKAGVISGVAQVYIRHDFQAEKRAALGAWSNRVAWLLDENPRENVVSIVR